MKAVFGSLVGEVVSLVGYSVLTVVMTLGGLFTESVGVEYLLSGEVVVGVWFLYFGLLGVFAGLYGFGYRSVLPLVRRRLISH